MCSTYYHTQKILHHIQHCKGQIISCVFSLGAWWDLHSPTKTKADASSSELITLCILKCWWEKIFSAFATSGLSTRGIFICRFNHIFILASALWGCVRFTSVSLPNKQCWRFSEWLKTHLSVCRQMCVSQTCEVYLGPTHPKRAPAAVPLVAWPRGLKLILINTGKSISECNSHLVFWYNSHNKKNTNGSTRDAKET